MSIRSAAPWMFALLGSLLPAPGARATEPAEPVPSVALHNVFKLDRGLYSGNAPDGAEGFRELRKLGVKTIISVDRSPPNLKLARQYGMRYIHLPIGYDGVPQTRAVELTKAAQIATASGSIYLHCHHGKHRGPAAAAIVCRALDGWSQERAGEFLQQAGTSPDYPGLFRDVKAFRPPSADELARRPVIFPESTKPPPLVDAMVALDEHLDVLKAAKKTGWREVPGHPSLTPGQASTLLWERFRELSRDPDTTKRGPDYKKFLTDSEQAADALRLLLVDSKSSTAARDAALQSTAKTCGACHQAHRNQAPLGGTSRKQTSPIMRLPTRFTAILSPP